MVWKDPRKAPSAGAAAPAAALAPSAAPPPPVAGATAPLPPVQPPPPAAPTASAPAAEAPKRGRGRPAAAAAATVPATPAASTPAAVSVPAQLPIGFLALLNAPGTKGVLAAFLDGQLPPGEPNIFPMIELLGGDVGGSFDFHSMNDEATNADLPRGKDPFAAILLGYRYEIVLWPKGFKRGEKQVPRLKGILPYNEIELGGIAQLAVQKYSFRNRATQDIFDPVGHPQAYLDLLAYDITAGLISIRTTGTYESAQQTAKEVLSAFPEGIPQPTPVVIQPFTFPVQSKTQSWNDHAIQVRQQSAGDEAGKVIAAFKEFFTANGQDPALTAAVADWGKLTLNDDMIHALQTIGNM